MIRRIVFDTSTLVSAALRVDSIPYQALAAALSIYDLCASPETLAELERVLLSRKFDRYLDRASRNEFAALLRRHVEVFAAEAAEVAAVEPRCRDPKDNQFLALATVSGAELIVSSDDDLVVLRPWKNVTILRPAEFVAMIGAGGR